jgi:GTPase SAR1 family protein
MALINGPSRLFNIILAPYLLAKLTAYFFVSSSYIYIEIVHDDGSGFPPHTHTPHTHTYFNFSQSLLYLRCVCVCVCMVSITAIIWLGGPSASLVTVMSMSENHENVHPNKSKLPLPMISFPGSCGMHFKLQPSQMYQLSSFDSVLAKSYSENDAAKSFRVDDCTMKVVVSPQVHQSKLESSCRSIENISTTKGLAYPPSVISRNAKITHRASSKRKNIKILVIGNAKCGKSSLISKYAFGTFDEGYKTTVGADFVRKDVIHQSGNDLDCKKESVRMQLWDIAGIYLSALVALFLCTWLGLSSSGQDRFQKLTRAYFSSAKGVIIVCDVNREGSIEAVRQWRREVEEWAAQTNPPRPLPVVLFANKADTIADSQQALRMGGTIEKLCREENVLAWFSTSARTGESVEEGFRALLEEILRLQREEEEEEGSSNITTQVWKHLSR